MRGSGLARTQTLSCEGGKSANHCATAPPKKGIIIKKGKLPQCRSHCEEQLRNNSAVTLKVTAVGTLSTDHNNTHLSKSISKALWGSLGSFSSSSLGKAFWDTETSQSRAAVTANVTD